MTGELRERLATGRLGPDGQPFTQLVLHPHDHGRLRRVERGAGGRARVSVERKTRLHLQLMEGRDR